MTKAEFAKKILHCSYSLWQSVLVGERNLSYKKAKIASQVFMTDIETWIDPALKDRRLDAWRRFNEGKK